MKSYYNILDKLRNHFESDELVNAITTGDIFQVDIDKQTIFPYVHIMVNNAQFIDSTVVFNVSLICMDIVDKSKKEVTDKFITNDNEFNLIDIKKNKLFFNQNSKCDVLITDKLHEW